MPTKNSLSSVKTRNTSMLETAHEKEAEENKTDSSVIVKNKVGRKTKPESEKESRPLMLKIKEGEYMALKEKAGLVPVSSYLKYFLRNKTDLFK